MESNDLGDGGDGVEASDKKDWDFSAEADAEAEEVAAFEELERKLYETKHSPPASQGWDNRAAVLSQVSTKPPVSNLVSRVFHQPQAQTTPSAQPETLWHEYTEDHADEEVDESRDRHQDRADSASDVDSTNLDRLHEAKLRETEAARAHLEKQKSDVDRFRRELRAAWSDLREERRTLDAERAHFLATFDEQKKAFEQWRKEEQARLKREKRVLARQRNAAAAVTGSAEQQREIEQLRAQLTAAKTAAEQREAALRKEAHRQKEVIGALRAQVRDLEESVRAYEEERLRWKWQHGATSALGERPEGEEEDEEEEADGDDEDDDEADGIPGEDDNNNDEDDGDDDDDEEAEEEEEEGENAVGVDDAGFWEPPSSGVASQERSQQEGSYMALHGRRSYRQVDFCDAGSETPHGDNRPEDPSLLSLEAIARGDLSLEKGGTMDSHAPSSSPAFVDVRDLKPPIVPPPPIRHLQGERALNGGKIERRYSDGSKVVQFRNGTEKETRANGPTIVRFANGDIKHTYAETNLVVYYYAEAETTHTTYNDGTQVFHFPTGQLEKHLPDGSKEIRYPDGTFKAVSPSGEQRSTFPDGTVMVELPDGTQEVLPPPPQGRG